MCVHVCVYRCMCVCVCMYVCISVYMCACAFVCARMWCRRILFICTIQSLYYMRVYHRCFLTLVCVCGRGLEVGFVSACSWLALFTGVGGYVLAGVEIRVFVLYNSLFLRVLGCCVCVYLYTRVHSDSVLSKTVIFPQKGGGKREISNESARGSSLRETNV